MRSCLVLAALLMSGCAATSHDISTGGPTAVVKGFNSFGPVGSRCTLMAEPDYGDYVNSAAVSSGTLELTIDAGPARLLAKCSFADFIAWSGTAILEFEAAAGHVYTIRRGSQEPECLELVDISDDETVVSCEPFSTGRYLNLSTGEPSAFLNGGYFIHQDHARCMIFIADHPPSPLVRTEPGEITIKVQCDLEGFFGGDVDGVAHFSTTMTANHEYAFLVTEDETICLIDQTTGQNQVSCQPYERVLGLDFSFTF